MSDRDAILVKAAAACEAFGAALRELIQARDEESLTVAEVASAEKCSRTFVREEIRHGRLKATRLGPKVWRVSRADYAAYKKRRTA